MTTPTHVVLACLAFGRRPGTVPTAAAGALLPDLPMFGFFAWQTLWRKRSQPEIWSEAYFDPAWQLGFDAFNSIPIYAALLALGLWLARPTLSIFAASALLHTLCDLPLHREDAHAHFWPFTRWHFVSAVSYWDPAHYGRVFSALELALLAGGSVHLARRATRPAWRVAWIALVAGCAAAWAALYLWA